MVIQCFFEGLFQAEPSIMWQMLLEFTAHCTPED